jgi:hypothetical protein
MPIAIKIKNTINISNNNASILKPNTIQDKIFAIFAFCGISKPFKLAMRLALLAMTNDTIAKIKLPNPNNPDNGKRARIDTKLARKNEMIAATANISAIWAYSLASTSGFLSGVDKFDDFLGS